MELSDFATKNARLTVKIIAQTMIEIPCDRHWFSFATRAPDYKIGTVVREDSVELAQEVARQAVTSLRDACNDWLDGADV